MFRQVISKIALASEVLYGLFQEPQAVAAAAFMYSNNLTTHLMKKIIDDFAPVSDVKKDHLTFNSLHRVLKVHSLSYLSSKDLVSFIRANRECYSIGNDKVLVSKNAASKLEEKIDGSKLYFPTQVMFMARAVNNISEKQQTLDQIIALRVSARQHLSQLITVFFSGLNILHADIIPFMLLTNNNNRDIKAMLNYIFSNSNLINQDDMKVNTSSALDLIYMASLITSAQQMYNYVMNNSDSFDKLIQSYLPEICSQEISNRIYNAVAFLGMIQANIHFNKVIASGVNKLMQRTSSGFFGRQCSKIYNLPFKGLQRDMINCINTMSDEEIAAIYSDFQKQSVTFNEEKQLPQLKR